MPCFLELTQLRQLLPGEFIKTVEKTEPLLTSRIKAIGLDFPSSVFFYTHL